MEAGGERRKRKMNSPEEGEEKDDEEEKMEKFFALIKSTREVRDRLRNHNIININNPNIESKLEQAQERKFDIALGHKPPAGIWNPTFQPEDFLQGDVDNCIDINNTPPGCEGEALATEPGPSNRENHDQGDNHKPQLDNKQGNGLELDLNLSL